MFQKLFQKTIAFIYKTLGATASSKLVASTLGKLLFKVIFKGKGKRIYTTNHGIQLELDPSESMYSGIGLLGTYNPFETHILEIILRSGDIVIDVGAFIGWYSLLAGKLVGNKGRVFSFEPSHIHFQELTNNIVGNKLHNIKTFNVAVSNKNDKVSFWEAGRGSSLIEKEAEIHNSFIKEPIQVTTVTLNDFIEREKIQHIDFIKIDAEGWDLQILKGATNILKKKDAPDIMVEVIDEELKRVGFSADELIRYMESFGYTPYTFTGNGLRIYKKQDTRTPNLLFRKKLK